ncbi:MAG: right-handed parallel beta-helix repeat-containing protein [Caldilineaceae bacterium]|nr:right-handed parallel beta-helix repeat-containing protein [Caldilineaceae bacterium]
MELDGSDIVYKVNSAEVGRLGSNNSTYFGNIILQAYNFNDTSLGSSYNAGNAYDAFWDNVKTATITPFYNVTADTYHPTLQAAINAATAGDTIEVAAGTYTEEINLNKAVTIEGANAGIAAGAYPATRGAETIINGGFIVSASGAKIDGLTIQNGRSSGGVKVGVAVATSTVTIANTIIESVASPAQSDGISTQPGNNNLTVSNSTIRNNWRGIYLNPGSGHVLTGNLIESNNGVGVGIGSDGLSNTTLVGNTFTGNNLEGWGSSAVGANVSAHFNVFNGGANGIYHYGGNAIHAINNWWGNASGPTHASNSGGTGAVVTNNVFFDPWLGVEVSTVDGAILDEDDVLSGPDGSSATNNGPGNYLVVLSKFVENPSGVPNFTGASAFYDIFVSGATATDSLTVVLPAAPGGGHLYYYDGSEWKEVLNGGNPISPSGGVYTFTLDDTSVPKLTELDGTPFTGAGNEEISISPSTSTVAAGETFQVVVEAGSDALFGVDVSLNFSTTVFSVTNIALGSGLTPGTIAVNTYNNSLGTLRFAYSQLGANITNTTGISLTLATVTFLAHSAGNGEIALGAALFTDKDGNPATPAPLNSPIALTVDPSPTVFVDVALQGRSDHAGMQLEVKPTLTGNILYDATVTAGKLEIANVPAGGYTARVSAPKYLAAVQDFTLPANVATYDLGGVLTLRGGDINGDDRINIQDLVLIGVNFGTNTASADINGDGIVNIQDLAIAAGNYGLQTGNGPFSGYPVNWE